MAFSSIQWLLFTRCGAAESWFVVQGNCGFTLWRDTWEASYTGAGVEARVMNLQRNRNWQSHDISFWQTIINLSLSVNKATTGNFSLSSDSPEKSEHTRLFLLRRRNFSATNATSPQALECLFSPHQCWVTFLMNILPCKTYLFINHKVKGERKKIGWWSVMVHCFNHRVDTDKNVGWRGSCLIRTNNRAKNAGITRISNWAGRMNATWLRTKRFELNVTHQEAVQFCARARMPWLVLSWMTQRPLYEWHQPNAAGVVGWSGTGLGWQCVFGHGTHQPDTCQSYVRKITKKAPLFCKPFRFLPNHFNGWTSSVLCTCDSCSVHIRSKCSSMHF